MHANHLPLALAVTDRALMTVAADDIVQTRLGVVLFRLQEAAQDLAGVIHPLLRRSTLVECSARGHLLPIALLQLKSAVTEADAAVVLHERVEPSGLRCLPPLLARVGNLPAVARAHIAHSNLHVVLTMRYRLVLLAS